MSRIKYYNSDSASWEYVNTTVISSGLRILGYYSTLDSLTSSVTSPKAGDAYGVGASDPYEIYIYDPQNGWINNGIIQGKKGDDGKTAYEYAQEGGYTGTEKEFSTKLAEEIPNKLPNPNALTFTGAVIGSYDGSEELNIEIPVPEVAESDIVRVIITYDQENDLYSADKTFEEMLTAYNSGKYVLANVDQDGVNTNLFLCMVVDGCLVFYCMTVGLIDTYIPVNYFMILSDGSVLTGDYQIASSAFKGAKEDTDGQVGYVPAPAEADRNKYLKGDGTWSELPIPSTTINDNDKVLMVVNGVPTWVTITNSEGVAY